MASEAVTDTGPVIHLTEVKAVKSFRVFSRAFVPLAVREEFEKLGALPDFLVAVNLSPREKQLAVLFSAKYKLGLGESEAIILAKRLKAVFLTDDLQARIMAQAHGIETHGTIGLLLRAFRESLLTEKQVITALEALLEKSTIFVTVRLVQEAKKAVQDYSEKRGKR